MDIQKIRPAFEDARGVIADILVRKEIDAVTMITSKAGAVRANHYHKETIQWVYLISGKLKSLTQKEGEGVRSVIMVPGDLIMTDINEKHAIHAIEDSMFLVLTRGPRSGADYESDTFRLSQPLRDDQ